MEGFTEEFTVCLGGGGCILRSLWERVYWVCVVENVCIIRLISSSPFLMSVSCVFRAVVVPGQKEEEGEEPEPPEPFEWTDE